MPTLNINGRSMTWWWSRTPPLLWAIREQVGPHRHEIRLRRRAVRRTCSVHINGEVQRSCVMPVSAHRRASDRIVTIEGLSANASHPGATGLRRRSTSRSAAIASRGRSWQCRGAPAKEAQAWTDNDIDDAMTNICRCGTYQRIRAAVHMAAGNKVATAGNAPAATPGGGSDNRERKEAGEPVSAAGSSSVPRPLQAAAWRSPALPLPFAIDLGAARSRAATPAADSAGGHRVGRDRRTTAAVIRIARLEMGQGTMTGLAQLVVEEARVRLGQGVDEFPTPGEALARKRAWGEFGTGKPRHPRSQDYVRKGGAAA